MVNVGFPPHIVDARKRKLSWLDVARAFQEWEAGGLPADSLQPPIRIAEQRTGYSANQIRRMLAALSFLQALEVKAPSLRKSLGTPRFSHAEMLAKIWRTDPSALIALLKRKPVLRYQDLYQLHDDIQKRSAPAPMAAGKRASAALKQRFIAHVKKSENFLSYFGAGAYALLELKAHHSYAKPHLIIRYSPPEQISTRWIGIDFICTASNHDDAAQRRMMMMATQASFLDAQIVVVPQGEGFKAVERVIEDLGLRNFGIVIVDERYPIRHRDPSGLPEPDRRRSWREPGVSNTLARWIMEDLSWV